MSHAERRVGASGPAVIMQPTGDHEEDVRRRAVRQALGALGGLLGVGIVAVDRDGRAWFRSQRWQDCSNTGGPDFHHRHWYDGVHPDDREAVAARWRSLLGRPGRLGTFRVTGMDGLVRQCRAKSVPMIGADGEIDGHLLIVTDAERTVTPSGEPLLAALPMPDMLGPVLAGAPDVITILNEDGSWRWSSGAALQFFGHQAEFDAHDWIERLLHPDDVPVAQEVFARTLAGERPPGEPFQFRARAADGSYRVLEGLFDVLLDEPSVRGVVVHVRDVTEQHRVLGELEASNRRLADVISSMKAAVLLEDEHGAIVLANQAFVDLFHLAVTPEDTVGRTLEEVGFTIGRIVVDPPNVAELRKAVIDRSERIETARAVLVDGRTVEVDFVPTRTQEADRGTLWTVRDISRRARAEAERERLLASEQEENRRLAETDAYRSESIAAVSHELRTPLTSIVGYTQLLRGTIVDSGRAEELEYVDAIARNVDRLLRLAGDVVALDSLESRTLPLRVALLEVADILGQAAASVAPEAAGRGITVSLDVVGERRLAGDADRLVQLFENLLSNAVKFTPLDGRISVTARPTDAGWLVEVADTGIGIPEDEVELLFGRFFRASNARTRGIPGSGLGLSVARAIAERHRGSITVTSTVGVGTTVWVRLGDAPDEEPEGGPGRGSVREREEQTGAGAAEARAADAPAGAVGTSGRTVARPD